MDLKPIDKMSILSFWRTFTSHVTKSTGVSKCKSLVERAFSEKNLLYTNVTISISMSALGDTIEQTYELYTGDEEMFDKARTAYMGWSGAAVGILCHNWYKILDRLVVGRSADVIVKKILLDQVIFSPIMIITFFGSLALFEDDPIENFKGEMREKFIKLYKAEWMVWPPAQVINFYFLPTKYRVLYDNAISLGYDIYSSQIKHSKKKNSE